VIKLKTPTATRLPITEARINLGQVVKRAHLNKEYFILEKDGIPVAGIMSADELEDYLEMRDPAIHAQIKKSNADIAAGRTRPAGDLLTELRAARTARQKRSAKR
jgi:PHD/YefM family antitoxin component YafN of YafNO toxin-antitoxin module